MSSRDVLRVSPNEPGLRCTYLPKKESPPAVLRPNQHLRLHTFASCDYPPQHSFAKLGVHMRSTNALNR